MGPALRVGAPKCRASGTLDTVVADILTQTTEREGNKNMGTIDRVWVKVTCEHCKVSETATAAEKGSGWGSSWNSLGDFDKFNASVRGGGNEMPDVLSATCKKCGNAATLTSECGFERPVGF